jgi:hypothetical protein
VVAGWWVGVCAGMEVRGGGPWGNVGGCVEGRCGGGELHPLGVRGTELVEEYPWCKAADPG